MPSLTPCDGADFASVQRNDVLFKGFGSTNKESLAELFVPLMSQVVPLHPELQNEQVRD